MIEEDKDVCFHCKNKYRDYWNANICDRNYYEFLKHQKDCERINNKKEAKK